MFGSGLPVCALSYSCITELVTHGQTGETKVNCDQTAFEEIGIIIKAVKPVSSLSTSA